MQPVLSIRFPLPVATCAVFYSWDKFTMLKSQWIHSNRCNDHKSITAYDRIDESQDELWRRWSFGCVKPEGTFSLFKYNGTMGRGVSRSRIPQQQAGSARWMMLLYLVVSSQAACSFHTTIASITENNFLYRLAPLSKLITLRRAEILIVILSILEHESASDHE